MTQKKHFYRLFYNDSKEAFWAKQFSTSISTGLEGLFNFQVHEVEVLIMIKKLFKSFSLARKKRQRMYR